MDIKITGNHLLKYRKVTRPGIEPRTFWTYTRCSNQLSYPALEFNQLILYICNCQPKDTYSAKHIQCHSLHARLILWPWHDQISQSGNHVTDYIIQFQQMLGLLHKYIKESRIALRPLCILSTGCIDISLLGMTSFTLYDFYSPTIQHCRPPEPTHRLFRRLFALAYLSFTFLWSFFRYNLQPGKNLYPYEDFTLPHLFQVDSTGVQVHLVESRWSPGTIYFAGSPAKLLCIIHMEFMWTPCGVQVNHLEWVDSTYQIQGNPYFFV